MDFNEPHDRPESATVEHLNDATLGSVRKQKHRRLAHQICNRMRNEFRMQAERQFAQWVAGRVADEAAQMNVEKSVVVPRSATRPLRAGWEEAAKGLPSEGDAEPAMRNFGNEGDAELTW